MVGPGTQQVLEPHTHRGINLVFTPSKATAATLAEELPLPDTGSVRVLYPASVKAADTLEKALTRRGFTVVRLNTYDTRAVTTLPRRLLEVAMDADIVTLGSPTAVYAWINAVGVELAQ